MQPEATKKAIKWIKDKIMHSYYMKDIEDKLLVERLLNTSLVPFSLESKERMKKLFLLFTTIDEYATKAFIGVSFYQIFNVLFFNFFFLDTKSPKTSQKNCGRIGRKTERKERLERQRSPTQDPYRVSIFAQSSQNARISQKVC